MRSLNTTRNVIAVLVGALIAMPLAARADADLQIALTDEPSVIHYGETVTYTATITNLGPSLATGVEITAITLPAPLVLKSVSGCTAPEGQTAPVPCTVDNGQIVDQTTPATPSFDKVVTFSVELPIPAAGLPTTCPDGSGLSAVSIKVGSATTDPVPGNDTATSGVPAIGGWADLGVELSAPATSNIGDTFDVTAKVTNHGPCDATKVRADDEQGITSLGLVFLGADGDCAQDPTAAACKWDTLPAAAGSNTKTWTLHYQVAPFPGGLMQASEIVSLTVYSTAATAFDYNPDNDVARTDTIVKKDQANCSTGGMGQALSLLLLAVPFLRRRRKS
jgi:uncharacterized repeat protein (TIGR01451 family)/MYXO-CTERM domain-containing protein